MISVIEQDDSKINLALEGELSIYVVDDLNQQLDGYLQNYQAINIDMSNVSELDTSVYQVLLRAKLLSMNNNKELNIDNLNEVSQRVFDLYSLNDIFHQTSTGSH